MRMKRMPSRDRESYLNVEMSRRMTKAKASYTGLWSIGNHLSLPRRSKLLCNRCPTSKNRTHAHRNYFLSLRCCVACATWLNMHDFTSQTASRLDEWLERDQECSGERAHLKRLVKVFECWLIYKVKLIKFTRIFAIASVERRPIQTNWEQLCGGGRCRRGDDATLYCPRILLSFDSRHILSSVFLFIYRTIYNRQTSTVHKQKTKSKTGFVLIVIQRTALWKWVYLFDTVQIAFVVRTQFVYEIYNNKILSALMHRTCLRSSIRMSGLVFDYWIETHLRV